MNRRPMIEGLQSGLDEERTARFLNPDRPGLAASSPVKRQPPPPRVVQAQDAPVGEQGASGLPAITVRVPREVPNALFRAAVDRKLHRHHPWTQQAIVAEALVGWLRRNGYLE